jgi:hypothetical protein
MPTPKIARTKPVDYKRSCHRDERTIVDLVAVPHTPVDGSENYG